VYFRVPNDIVDLINLEDSSQVTLTLEQKSDRHLLVYSVIKNDSVVGDASSRDDTTRPTQGSIARNRTVAKPREASVASKEIES